MQPCARFSIIDWSMYRGMKSKVCVHFMAFQPKSMVMPHICAWWNFQSSNRDDVRFDPHTCWRWSSVQWIRTSWTCQCNELYISQIFCVPGHSACLHTHINSIWNSPPSLPLFNTSREHDVLLADSLSCPSHFDIARRTKIQVYLGCSKVDNNSIHV